MRISFALQCYAVSATLGLAGCLGSTITYAGSGSGQKGSAAAGNSAGNVATSSGTSGALATATGGSSSGGTTTGAPAATCAADATPCTPANICDNGCTEAGGGCLDELTANLAQTGVSCDAGAVCEGTICYVGSGPQVPNNGGGVLEPPKLVLMTYDSDPNQAALEKWGVWFMDGGIVQTVLSQYGVSDGTIQFVHLTDLMPAEDQQSLGDYIEQHLESDATMPANTSSTVYLLSMPASWSGTTSFCQNYGGYHTVLFDQSRNYPVWAVIANCTGDLQNDLEVSASHEIAEAVTDPYEQSWAFTSSTDSWSLSGGGEIGDMCESNSTHYQTSDGQYYSQYLWSNGAARVGEVPCQPWPADQVYVQTLGPTTVQTVAPGVTANIPLVGWASAPIDQWALIASDPISPVDFSTYPTISSETVAPGQTVMAQLNIPPATQGQPAVGGLIGGAWIFSATDNSHVYGSTMLEVQISCQTSADCANPAYSCTNGACGYNYCGNSAQPFSACSATQGNDGVCLPFDSGNGNPVEICSQVGSLTVGTQGCGTTRIVGGGAANYCDATSICEGASNPACFSLCGSNGCGGNQYCYPLGQSYGFCLDECNSTACPSGTTCYNVGSGLDLCYPTGG